MIPDWAEGCVHEYCKDGHGELPEAVVTELEKISDFSERAHEYRLAVWLDVQAEEYNKPGHGNLQAYQVAALESIPGWVEEYGTRQSQVSCLSGC